MESICRVLFQGDRHACAQYDVRSPIGTSCHFAYAADAPLLSLSRHFPRFSGGIYPEGGSEFCFIVFASAAKQTPGRVAKKYAILSMPSK